MIVRPTLPEQLRGLRRILDQVVAPAVAGDYERSTLEGVIRSLEMLEQRVDDVGPFLAWDNLETASLLRSIATRLAVSEQFDSPSVVGAGDVVALDAENERLRGMLTAVLPVLVSDPSMADLHATVIAHLRVRLARYPFTSTATLPSR